MGFPSLRLPGPAGTSWKSEATAMETSTSMKGARVRAVIVYFSQKNPLSMLPGVRQQWLRGHALCEHR